MNLTSVKQNQLDNNCPQLYNYTLQLLLLKLIDSSFYIYIFFNFNSINLVCHFWCRNYSRVKQQHFKVAIVTLYVQLAHLVNPVSVLVKARFDDDAQPDSWGGESPADQRHVNLENHRLNLIYAPLIYAAIHYHLIVVCEKECSVDPSVAPHHGCCHSELNTATVFLFPFLRKNIFFFFYVHLQNVTYSYTMILQRRVSRTRCVTASRAKGGAAA